MNSIPSRLIAIFSTAATYASRIVCVCCTVWLGVIVMPSVRPFSIPRSGSLSEFRHTPERVKPSMLLPQDGFWSFEDVGFDIQSRRVSPHQLDEHFSTATTDLVLTDIDASPLIALAEAHNAIRTDGKSESTWTVRLNSFRAVLVASQSEPPRLMTVCAAQKTGTGWELFELGKCKSATSSDHLLPLPTSSIRQCSRQSPSGELLMELVQTAASADSLLRQWGEQGWDIRQSDFGPDLGFSYLCVKDATVVYAWSAANCGPRTLMLSKSDDVEKTYSADSNRTGLLR